MKSLLLLIIGAPMLLFAQATNPAPRTQGKIAGSAVWQPPANFLAKAQACFQGPGTETFEPCLIDQMSASGAPADAVAFTRMLFKQTDGQVGIMSAFKSVGPVDEAQVLYPLRANDNYALLLINGDSSVIDVDDLTKLDRTAMEADPLFQSVKQKYPKIELFPGDRSGSAPWPRVQPLAGGGTQFIVTYPLLNGCHACEHVGLARFAWDFDASGKFLHTTFIPTPPPPRMLRRPERPQPPQFSPPPQQNPQ